MNIQFNLQESLRRIMKQTQKIRRKKFILAGFTICLIYFLIYKYITNLEGVALYIFALGAYMFIYNTLYVITEWISQKRK